MKERRNGGTEGGREGRKGRENNTRTNDSTALDKGYTVLLIKHRFTMNEESSNTIPVFKWKIRVSFREIKWLAQDHTVERRWS